MLLSLKNGNYGGVDQDAEDEGLVLDSAEALFGDKGSGRNGGDGGGKQFSAMDDGEDPGLFGENGLLSMPKVKALLFLVWGAQVRGELFALS